MKQTVQRLSLTLIGLSSITLARHALMPPEPNQDIQSSSHKPVSHHWAAGIVAESLSIISGDVDTVSASSAGTENGGGGGNGWEDTTTVPPVGGGSGSENSGSPNQNISQPLAPPVKTPDIFTSPRPCVQIALPVLPNSTSRCTTADGKPGITNDPATGGAITAYAKDGMRLVSGSIGGIIVLMIVISGVQYIISMGNPAAITAAKKRLTNAFIALVLFIMAFAILNFLVLIPGGLAV